jgi:hypothetical protein
MVGGKQWTTVIRREWISCRTAEELTLILSPPSRVTHFLVYSGIGTRGLFSMRDSALHLGETGRPVEGFVISAKG